jgi:signal transduction histidine kinase
MNFHHRYIQYYLAHFSSFEVNKTDGLPYLRDKLFISILFIAAPICFVVYIPSMYVSVVTHQYVIGLFDTIAMTVLLIVCLVKKQSLWIKKLMFSFIFYVLPVVLFIYFGSKGPSIAILFCISALITLYQSKRAGVISVLLNAAIVFFFMFPFAKNSANPIFYNDVKSVMTVTLNILAFNLVTVLSIASMLNQLNESYQKERKLQELLKQESGELLLAKHKAEESDKLKSAFLANMSHEIRTPMNGILGFSELLSEPGLTGEDQQEYIRIIQKSGARMLNIISEIVDFSKIESGQVDLNCQRTNVNEKIEFVYHLLKQDAEQKGITISVSKGFQDEDAFFFTDAEKLCAILTNLVKNAIKYTDQGSVEFGYNRAGQQNYVSLLFYVKDTGIGIPFDRQEAIFERFIQADISDVQARQGAGLGLSIAKSYVEMLNGRIWVESEPDKGSSFYFLLPAKHDSVGV